MIGGDDLGKIGAGERLHAALEEPHGGRQHPELPDLRHEHGKQPDAGIGDDTYEDQKIVAHLFGEFAKEDGGGESDDLRQKERQKQVCRIEPERGPERRRHIDDGIHAVDVQKEGDEEEDDALFVGDAALFGEDRKEALKVVAHGVRGTGHKVRLTVGMRKGAGEPEPPERVDGERDGDGDGIGKIGQQHDGDADKEGHAAADVSPGVALGRDVVGAVVRGHVHEHGVVKDEARRIKDLGEHEHDQKDQPRHGDAQRRAADDACHRKEQKDGALIARKIAQRAQRRTEDGNGECHDARGVSPIGGRRRRVHAALSRQIVEVDGHDGADEQGECRIAHVVQDPVAFQPAGRGQSFHIFSSLSKLL